MHSKKQVIAKLKKAIDLLDEVLENNLYPNHNKSRQMEKITDHVFTAFDEAMAAIWAIEDLEDKK